jgi:1-pyrroline-5-carboxylate dehydrogenase
MWNQTELRPLEGFTFALTPFNFTAIAGNLPCAPALMGNTVVWKPSESQMLAAWHTMLLLEEAGLPPGVINLVPGFGHELAPAAVGHRDLGAIHFTGSTEIFRSLWKQVAGNLEHYKSYPRLVGETGGKDFIVAHPSADPAAVATAILRGAFEYQGQKCSAASRVYVPQSVWHAMDERLVAETEGLKVGDVRDYGNFMGAVIKQARSIATARRSRRPAARPACGWSPAASATTARAGSCGRRSSPPTIRWCGTCRTSSSARS